MSLGSGNGKRPKKPMRNSINSAAGYVTHVVEETSGSEFVAGRRVSYVVVQPYASKRTKISGSAVRSIWQGA